MNDIKKDWVFTFRLDNGQTWGVKVQDLAEIRAKMLTEDGTATNGEVGSSLRALMDSPDGVYRFCATLPFYLVEHALFLIRDMPAEDGDRLSRGWAEKRAADVVDLSRIPRGVPE